MSEVVKIKFNDIFIYDKSHQAKNARRFFSPQEMADLRESIRDHGLWNNIVVRQHADKYAILAGERRYRAISALLEVNENCWNSKSKAWMPARKIYTELEVSRVSVDGNEEAIVIGIQDNLLREDIRESDKIRAIVEYDNMLDDDGNRLFDRKKLAKLFKKSEAWISTSISLSEAHPAILEGLDEGLLNRNSASELLKTKLEYIPIVIERLREQWENSAKQEIESLEQQIQEGQEEITEIDSQIDQTKTRIDGVSAKDKVKLRQSLESRQTEREKKSKDLENARQRLGRMNKGSASGPRPAFSAEDVAKVNEDLGVREGAPRAFSPAKLRKFSAELEEVIRNSNGSVNWKDKKISARDVGLMYLVSQMFLGKVPEDLHLIINDADKVVKNLKETKKDF